MTRTGYIALLIFVHMLTACTKNINHSYSKKNVKLFQVDCENAVRSWVKDHAAFPDSYIPLQFTNVTISTTWNDAVEVVPLRKYTIGHTLLIKNKEGQPLYTNITFELTPDFFVQKVRDNHTGDFSLSKRFFPPDYTLWTENYGRIITAADTLAWNQHNRSLIAELNNSFLINRYIDPEGENPHLTDSLVKQLNIAFSSR